VGIPAGVNGALLQFTPAQPTTPNRGHGRRLMHEIEQRAAPRSSRRASSTVASPDESSSTRRQARRPDGGRLLAGAVLAQRPAATAARPAGPGGGADREPTASTRQVPDLHRRPGLRQHLLEARRHRPDQEFYGVLAKSWKQRDAKPGCSTPSEATFPQRHKFTAADVKYPFERILNAKTASGYAPLYTVIEAVESSARRAPSSTQKNAVRPFLTNSPTTARSSTARRSSTRKNPTPTRRHRPVQFATGAGRPC